MAQAAEADGLREIARQDDDERKDVGDLGKADGEEVQQFGPAHDGPEIIPQGLEAFVECDLFVGFAAIEGNGFRVFAHADEAVTEIGFQALLVEGERHEFAADDLGEEGADYGIEHGDPEHVAGDGDAKEFDRAGDGVEHEDEAEQRDDVSDEIHAQCQAVGGEVAQILGDTLIRVVDDGAAALGQADVVIGAVGEPVFNVMRGEPLPPADLQHLVEVEGVYRDEDVDHDQLGKAGHGQAGALDGHQEVIQQVQNRGFVIDLDGVEEVAVPVGEDHIEGNQQQVEADDGAQQAVGAPAFLGTEIGFGKAPGLGEAGDEIGHGAAHGYSAWVRRRRMTPRASAGGTGLPLRSSSMTPALARRWAARRMGERLARHASPGGLPARARAASVGEMDFCASLPVSRERIAFSAGSVVMGLLCPKPGKSGRRLAWGEHGGDFSGGDGLVEIGALAFVAADFGEALELRFALHAVSQHGAAERVAGVDGGLDDGGAGAFIEVMDEGAVQPQGGDGQALEGAETGVAGAEIVERHAYAQALQGFEGKHGVVVVVDQHGFGEFQFQAVWGQAGGAEAFQELADQPAALHVALREVEGD